MILSINDRLELNIECITQLCGINVQMKNYIIRNIVKYFSNTKYAEYEDKDDKEKGRIRIGCALTC